MSLVSDCCGAAWISADGWPECDVCLRTCALVPTCADCGQRAVFGERLCGPCLNKRAPSWIPDSWRGPLDSRCEPE